MKRLYTFPLLIMIAISQRYITSNCKCSQLRSEDDCLKNFDLNCEWNSSKQFCNNTQIATTPIFTTYCSSFSEIDCPKTKPCDTCGAYAACQWQDNQCTHFTGCTAHQRTTDYECQAISNRCITDGIHCVEIGQCDSYLNELSCKRNQFLRYCYWNMDDSKCEDANSCEKLPITLNNDKSCRNEISTCMTVKEGGCQESGINCSDQKLEIQCIWNREMTINCYWNGVECQDKICNNAPTYMASDNICQSFLSSCTTKQGGGCITRTTCNAALIEAACIQNSNGDDCYWNGTECMDKICSNAPISMTNNNACAEFKTNCITKEGGGCIDNLQCDAANIEIACVKNIYGVECVFDNNQCKERICENAPQYYNTHELCESFLSTCTVKYDGGCQNKTCNNAPITLITNSDCEQYLPNNNCIAKYDGGCEYLSICSEITLKDNCIKDFQGNDCIFDGTCKNKTCSNSPTSNNTLQLCQSFLPTCTIDSNNKCIEKTCENIVNEIECTTDTNNKPCKWQDTCVTKQCVFASHKLKTIEECQKYKSTCTLSDQGYGCIQIPLRCEVFTNEATCIMNMRQNGQERKFCGWNGVICIDKSCDTAPKHIVHNVLCAQYLDGCVLAESGKGCQKLPQNCKDRKHYDICINESSQNCVWNIISNSCVQKICETASIFGIVGKLAIFNSENCFNYHGCLVENDGISGCIPQPQNCYSLSKANCQSRFIINNSIQCHWNEDEQTCKETQCENYLLEECEIKQCIKNKLGSGCQQRGACNSYNQIQCDEASKNQNGEVCIWNMNLEQPLCQEKSCYTAHSDFDDHLKCSQYGECTVAVVENNKQLIYRGCIPLSVCSSYIVEKQCILNASKSKCEWIDKKCMDFSCFTAPRYYDTHQACNTYKIGCTVNFYKQGCMEVPDKCEGMIFEQCLQDKNGNQCYWREESHRCITKTCNNVPQAIIDAKGCQTYLQECVQFDDVKCKTKVCEDFNYKTDFECKSAMSKCTTDGVKCVKRGTCLQALAQAGCITSSTGINCEWIDNSYCTNKNCNTAPITLKTESQCASYYPGCTTKNNGGCVKKSTCAVADTNAACTISSLGVKCFWDINKCRNMDCQDLNGKTHSDCKTQMSNCTIGLNEKCAKIQICENTTVREACIEGFNGPCLWIADACYSYQSCKSLSWTTNQKCKQISSQCTTNGSNCVSITKCSETNTNGGCFTGYDGQCIQYSSPQNDTKCKLYTQCSDANYLTHEECQRSNYKCTTNKQTGCIQLSDCSSYNNEESCKINDKGISEKNNQTIGRCIWDEITSSCRDQICTDLAYSTHELCNSIFYKCTSNGITCITQNKCSTYSRNSCNVGLDGTCVWDAEHSQCKLKTCNDIQNGIDNDICSKELSSCISDGIKCVQFSNCSTYSTQASCNNGGTDGVCVWQSSTGICSLMTSCQQASSDESACLASKLKCNWVPYDQQSGMSKCEIHTCTTYQQTNGICSMFLNWDSKLKELCAILNGVCSQINPAALTQSDCNIVTGNTYTWNTLTRNCDVCENSTQTANLIKIKSFETIQTESVAILFLNLVIYLIQG